MAEEKQTYQVETIDGQALRLKVRGAPEAGLQDVEQPAPSRKAPLNKHSVPHTREMVLKLIERFKHL